MLIKDKVAEVFLLRLIFTSYLNIESVKTNMGHTAGFILISYTIGGITISVSSIELTLRLDGWLG